MQSRTNPQAARRVCAAVVIAALAATPMATPGILAGEKGAPVNLIKDTGFELGTPNPRWREKSTAFGTPLCDSGCTEDNSNLARHGDWWAWYGGVSDEKEVGQLVQNVQFPNGGTATLVFWLWVPVGSGNGTDWLKVFVDDQKVFRAKEGQTKYRDDYVRVEVDVSSFCDGLKHKLKIRSVTSGIPDFSNFFVDDVRLFVS